MWIDPHSVDTSPRLPSFSNSISSFSSSSKRRRTDPELARRGPSTFLWLLGDTLPSDHGKDEKRGIRRKLRSRIHQDVFVVPSIQHSSTHLWSKRERPRPEISIRPNPINHTDKTLPSPRSPHQLIGRSLVLPSPSFDRGIKGEIHPHHTTRSLTENLTPTFKYLLADPVLNLLPSPSTILYSRRTQRNVTSE